MKRPTHKSIAIFAQQQTTFIFSAVSVAFHIIAAKTVNKNIGLNIKQFVKHCKLQIIYVGKITIMT